MELNKLTNIYVPTPEGTPIRNRSDWQPNIPFRKLNLDDILSMTIVYYIDCYYAQWNDETGGPDEKRVLFYIQKYRGLYIYDEFCKFAAAHPEEKFLLCEDQEGCEDFIRAYYESTNGNMKIYFLGNLKGEGKYNLLATVENKPNSVKWDKFEILDEKILSIELQSRYNATSSYHEFTMSSKARCVHESSFYLFNEKNGGQSGLHTDQILNNFLQIKDKTRIISSYDGCSYLNFYVSVEPRAMGTINERYGIEKRTEYYYSDYLHKDDVFPSAELDTATWERISKYLTNCLNDNQGSEFKDSGTGMYLRKDILIISDPVGIHRRPTYHLISGFKACGSIDIVELARGELLMKDMTPVSVYYLLPTGEYGRLSHSLLGTIRNYIIDKAEIDKVSLSEWTEEKSLHPELLTAFSQYVCEDAQIDLKQVKLLNKVPFGALFMEHLIKGGKYKLAISFAVYITNCADNMRYVCGSLSDILPDSNAEGTSLLKTLNITKPCLDLLFELGGNEVESFVLNYKAIKKVCPDGVLTKERKKLLQQYKELQSIGWGSVHCGTGRTVELINYPEETKMVYKMINKIKNTFSEGSGYHRNEEYEALRHYNEIMTAYFKFLDFGWNPADSLIFLEFSLTGERSEIMKMLEDREKAANTALSIYQNKIDEMAREQTENKYKHRIKNLIKLCNVTKLSKDKNSLFNKKYIMVAPSGIYDVEKDNTIEKEGNDMRHCVFRSYAEEIANGKYTVIYLRAKDDPTTALVTVGITKEGRINQTYTFNDASITEEQAKAIVEWAQSKKGLVTFKSEKVDVNPGGWNSKVEIPSLPKPDADWLNQLASIE